MEKQILKIRLCPAKVHSGKVKGNVKSEQVERAEVIDSPSVQQSSNSDGGDIVRLSTVSKSSRGRTIHGRLVSVSSEATGQDKSDSYRTAPVKVTKKASRSKNARNNAPPVAKFIATDNEVLFQNALEFHNVVTKLAEEDKKKAVQELACRKRPATTASGIDAATEEVKRLFRAGAVSVKKDEERTTFKRPVRLARRLEMKGANLDEAGGTDDPWASEHISSLDDI